MYQILSNVDPLKAMGCDQIGPTLLEHCALALYKPIYPVLVSNKATSLVNGELISLHQFINQVIVLVSPTIDPFHSSALYPRFWNVLYITIYCRLLQTPYLLSNLAFNRSIQLYNRCWFSLMKYITQ